MKDELYRTGRLSGYRDKNVVILPNAYKDKEVAKVKFREILEQKLDELGYDVAEIDFGDGYEDIEYFNLGRCGVYVEDDWFEMKIIYTNLD